MQSISGLRSAVPVAIVSRVSGNAPVQCKKFGSCSSIAPSWNSSLAYTRSPRSAAGVKTMAIFGFGSKPKKDESGLYSYTIKDIDGRNLDIAKYRGKALLIVNVASQCGFTTQYEGLTELYDKYKGQGLEILAFPCNQFGSQEPGDAGQIKSFASNRGAKFQLADKIDVNGTSEEPLYSFLKSEQGGFLTKDIKWNFTKFLCNKEGQVIKRYGTSTEPSAIEQDIVAALA